MQDTYRLVVRRGPQPNQTYDLTKDITTLGRDITNDIVINDREVSRHHMRLTRGADGFTIEDLGSTNGTFINGKRLSGVSALHNGDIIGLGETVTLVFEIARGQVTVPSSPPPAASAPVAPRREESPAPAPSYHDSPAPEPSPYQPPQAQPQQAPYQPQYQAPVEQPQQGYYSPAPSYSPPQAPPAQGYEYDPYAMRQDEGSNTTRWLIFGCIGLLLLCCCVSVLGLVAIDQLNLWCDVPVVSNVVQAIGLQACP